MADLETFLSSRFLISASLPVSFLTLDFAIFGFRDTGSASAYTRVNQRLKDTNIEMGSIHFRKVEIFAHFSGM